MKKVKKKILQPTNLDAIKAMRRGGREAEMELLGPGFHSVDRPHKSKKTYTRKLKNKKRLVKWEQYRFNPDKYTEMKSKGFRLEF